MNSLYETQAMQWSDIVRVEALAGGVASLGLELWIVLRLFTLRRLLYHYHALPLFSGALLVLTALFPADATLSVAATLTSCITALNVYNTYYVNVVTVRRFVAEIRTTDGPEALLTDLFLPKYTPRFYPWGPVAQVFYSVLTCAHVWIRSVALVEIIPNIA